jgi:hypothetical protein
VLRGRRRSTFHGLMSLTAMLVGKMVVVSGRESRLWGLRRRVLQLGVTLTWMS